MKKVCGTKEHLVKIIRKKAGRNPNPSYALIDSQSVKTAYASEQIGFDGGKGRKRHIATDTLGCMLALKVHKANLHDTKAGMFIAIQARRKYPTIQKFCGDRGYRGSFVTNVKTILDLDVDISEKIIPKGWVVVPKRWIVERTFAWLNHSRRLSKDYEILTSCAESMIKISHLHSLLNRL